MAYATIVELKARINKTGADADVVLTGLLDASTEAIDGLLNRPDGFEADALATARYYSGSGKPYQYIDECVEITEVAVKDSVTDDTYTAWVTPTTNMAGDGDWLAFTGDPMSPEFNPLVKLIPYIAIMIDPAGDESLFISGKIATRGGFRPSSGILRGAPTVRVTAKWGYSVLVPTKVREACVVQAARWWKRGESAWADAIATSDFGSLLFRAPIDPDLKHMLINSRLMKPAIG